MDHSQHSIHNHDHSMHADHSAHEHHAGLRTTTLAPSIDVMTLEDGTGIHVHDHSLHQATGGGGGVDHTLHHMMSMAFHFGYNETILFSWWQIDSVLGLIGSMVAIFIMAILYEGLKYYRESLFWKTYNLLEYRPVTLPPQRNPEDPPAAPPTTSSSPVQYVGEVIHKQPPTMLSMNHLYQTFLHMVQVSLSFVLMLIFMTYNVWLCIAVVLGAAVGYFLFCWKKSVIVDVTEHCH